ncbi:MAG: hypothetical protein D6725_03955 [Planctomycetota bacterium]|nr:MAG: hypothetical protein D6725_03955 [Planctomycetota bacterium]
MTIDAWLKTRRRGFTIEFEATGVVMDHVRAAFIPCRFPEDTPAQMLRSPTGGMSPSNGETV